MSKIASRWYSERLGADVRVARWGAVGRPLLLFPTAAGDAEEVERFHLVDAVAELLAAERLKVYSVDSLAAEAWVAPGAELQRAAEVQNRYDAFLVNEVVPAIRADCQDPAVEVLTAGASLGAYNALAAVCRHPDLFSTAICMSGTYDLTKFLQVPPGPSPTPDFLVTSPLHFLPRLPEGAHLDRLRTRFVLLAHGQGRWEEPSQSWRVADALGARGVPNRVDAWGGEWDHDWPTWRAMLPQYLNELL